MLPTGLCRLGLDPRVQTLACPRSGFPPPGPPVSPWQEGFKTNPTKWKIHKVHFLSRPLTPTPQLSLGGGLLPPGAVLHRPQGFTAHLPAQSCLVRRLGPEGGDRLWELMVEPMGQTRAFQPLHQPLHQPRQRCSPSLPPPRGPGGADSQLLLWGLNSSWSCRKITLTLCFSRPSLLCVCLSVSVHALPSLYFLTDCYLSAGVWSGFCRSPPPTWPSRPPPPAAELVQLGLLRSL